MIVDTSAVVAMLRAEPGHPEISRKLFQARLVAIGAPTLFEATMVMVGSVGESGRGLISRFLDEFEVEIIPFAALHWQIASEAFTRFGKGRHPAALNYGDCMTYATAQVAKEPLLYIGNDFLRTDLEAA